MYKAKISSEKAISQQNEATTTNNYFRNFSLPLTVPDRFKHGLVWLQTLGWR